MPRPLLLLPLLLSACSLWVIDGDGDMSMAIDDCADGNPDRYPGATEICDGIDNDCDHVVDEPGSVGETLWYLDQDGDGWGNTVVDFSGCAPLTGYVADPGDCDDTRVDVFPGAPEVCDGLDDDCDGTPEAPCDEICDDGVDNDGDGLLDCADDDCGADTGCV